MRKQNISEKALNLLLRRVDWRFLLRNPYPNKSICFTDGALYKAVEFISKSLTNIGSADNDCELAVAVNPDHKTLNAAWNALKIGGSCYIEWNVNPFFSPKTIRNNLEAVGFDQISLYLPKPDPSKSLTGIWIPLEDPRALAFFISESLKNKPHNIIRRVGILLRGFIWRLGSRLFITLPWFISPSLQNYTVCSIACKTSINKKSQTTNRTQIQSSGSSELICHTGNIIESKMKNLGLTKNSNNVSTMMLTEGNIIDKKVILFVFTGAQNEPDFIIKMTRITESVLEHSMEAETLRILEEKYGYTKRIPKLLFFEHTSHFSMHAETFIGGTSIDKILTKKNYRELAINTTEVVTDLAITTKNDTTVDSWDRLIKPILSNFVTAFENVLDQNLIQQTINIIKGLELTYLTCQHTDFSPWNILIRPNGELGIIDWEGSSLNGLPVVDLVYFMTFLSVGLEKEFNSTLFRNAYRKMLDESSYTGKVFKECTDYYTSRTGISSSSIPAFRLLTWLYMINCRYLELSQYENCLSAKAACYLY